MFMRNLHETLSAPEDYLAAEPFFCRQYQTSSFGKLSRIDRLRIEHRGFHESLATHFATKVSDSVQHRPNK